MYGKEKCIIIPKHDSFGLGNAANKKIVIKHGKVTIILLHNYFIFKFKFLNNYTIVITSQYCVFGGCIFSR